MVDRGAFRPTLSTATVTVCLLVDITLNHYSGIPAVGESILMLAVVCTGMGNRGWATLVIATLTSASVLSRPLLVPNVRLLRGR